MADFTDVMQLAEGISAYDLFPEKAPKTAKNVLIGDAKKVALNPGIVPPRREIGSFAYIHTYIHTFIHIVYNVYRIYILTCL